MKSLLVGLLATFLLLQSLWAQNMFMPTEQKVKEEERALHIKLLSTSRVRIPEQFVDIVVNVRYVKATAVPQDKSGLENKVKLPGFDGYINPSQDALVKEVTLPASETVLRYRTLMLLVTQPLSPSVERELRSAVEKAAGWDEEGKDIFKIVPVGSSLARAGKAQPEEEEEKYAVPVDPQLEAESAKHLLKARQAFFNNDLNLALTEVVESISISPNSAQNYAMLGSIYYRLNWKTMAIKNWKKSLELNPNNKKLKNYLERVKNIP